MVVVVVGGTVVVVVGGAVVEVGASGFVAGVLLDAGVVVREDGSVLGRFVRPQPASATATATATHPTRILEARGTPVPTARPLHVGWRSARGIGPRRLSARRTS